MIARIVLSALLLLGLCMSACDEYVAQGIGTSPSADDDPVAVHAAPVEHVQPCGLWVGASPAAAEARATAAPTEPDMVQLPRPGGLSCSALIAAQPAVEASYVGYSVVRYVGAP